MKQQNSFIKSQKTRCLAYFLKRGFKKKEADKLTEEFIATGLEFPDELLLFKISED